ncbi:MAG: hypothetical protein LKKZDAJK_002642 [Candidatus Fervidibacter sp.]
MACGFTLIELLVVIGIIAILAAILFPVFSQAREKARQATCLSNLKQLASAVQMYSQDYDEQLVLERALCRCSQLRDHLCPFCSRHSWVATLRPYLAHGVKTLTDPQGRLWTQPSGYHTYSCPSAAASTRRAWWLGYGYNFYYLGGYLGRLPHDWATPLVPTSLAFVAQPAATVMFCDAGMNDEGVRISSLWVHPPSARTNLRISRPDPRHFEGCNVAFVDAHVKWMRRDMPFYPPHPWYGNGILDPTHPDYKDQLWDLQ